MRICSDNSGNFYKTFYSTFSILVLMVLIACPAAASQPCKLAASGTLGPIPDDLSHVQGVSLTNDAVFVTSVDKNAGAALLWKIDRKTFKTIKSANLTEMFMIHPSGLQFDGKYLWLAIAVYSKDSKAKVLKIDPDTLKPLKKFTVADHIGLVASNGDGIVYGANWDAETFFIWKENGALIEKKPNPTTHGYQDCKVENEYLVCSGGGAVDFINRETWKVERSFEAPALPNGNFATREGMDFADGSFYFLPDDGAGTNIYIFKPDAKCIPAIKK
jgi:hypothetical protein